MNKLSQLMTGIIRIFSQGMLGADEWSAFSDAFKDLTKKMWVPMIAISTSAVVLWGLYLGWKFWSAGGDETKKKSAKSAVISFVVGIFVIFGVAVGAPLLIAALASWMQNQ
ncbi:MAG: hypothetical protein LBT30_01505 [Clostridiales bacterium]|nr:hypothetical protein [Clostridiales bacterium]